MKVVTGFAAALACASIISLHAQDREKTKTKIEGGKVNTVMYSGCVQTGTDAHSYVLNKVVPSKRTTTTTQDLQTGESVTSSSTSYMLVPDQTVELQQQVGHKVEVTGTSIPRGETRTKTKIEPEHGKDTTIVEKEKNEMAHFRVTSVTQLAERCE